VSGKVMGGLDAILSIVQMPKECLFLLGFDNGRSRLSQEASRPPPPAPIRTPPFFRVPGSAWEWHHPDHTPTGALSHSSCATLFSWQDPREKDTLIVSPSPRSRSYTASVPGTSRCPPYRCLSGSTRYLDGSPVVTCSGSGLYRLVVNRRLYGENGLSLETCLRGGLSSQRLPGPVCPHCRPHVQASRGHGLLDLESPSYGRLLSGERGGNRDRMPHLAGSARVPWRNLTQHAGCQASFV
jgi:hypothetical protein